tara:strand:+ start:10 stop:333 length:324 start_codon:yes stop_codon:yes gene_type:complete
MKRNRFDGGGDTNMGNDSPSKLKKDTNMGNNSPSKLKFDENKNTSFKYSGMTKEEAIKEWKKTATGNTRGVAGLIGFENSLPKGHPMKNKKRDIGRYKNHPLGKLLD